MPEILLVAVPSPLRRLFEYLPPDDASIAPGTRVLVPFGAQTLVGVVIGNSRHPTCPPEKLKAVDDVLDSEPLLPGDLLRLCGWCIDYYQHPPGEVLHTALPLGLRKPESSARTTLSWVHTTEGKGLPAEALRRSPKQQAVHQWLLQHGALDEAGLALLDVSRGIIRSLEQKGLIETRHSEETPARAAQSAAGSSHHQLLAETPFTLNAEQDKAVASIHYHHYGCYLLEGTTGSGKTEVYLHTIARVLEAGRQALVLVPEIGLAPQALQRFEQRFHVPVVALHSHVSEKKRTQNWHMARSGHARIVIGTRLAIFTPMPELGIIIIDEEHDLSFKQQDGLRYSARDLAVVRAHQRSIPLLLGSATPALETLQNALAGRYHHLRLMARAGDAQLPTCATIDTRNKTLQAGLTEAALQAIDETLQRREQVLVFINRRGFAPAWLCGHCGWTAGCPACDARLTLHHQPRHLRCHHCDTQRPVPSRCPVCQSRELSAVGQGTERAEQFLAQRFPNVDIIRVDQDSMQRKTAMQELTERLHNGEPCILVGTQMLAKGHHFPDITLAVLVDIDQGLYSGDFRGLERMGQQIVQVAGRAGRGSAPGRVILQTSQPDHPLLQAILHQGYPAFAQQLLQERYAASMPPFSYIALLRAESKRGENAFEFLKMALQQARVLCPPSPERRYLGPMPALLERRQDRFRFQLQINFAKRAELQQMLKALLEFIENHALAKRTRWSLDVDPQDMS